MEILITALLIAAISVYGALTLKRLYFLLDIFFFIAGNYVNYALHEENKFCIDLFSAISCAIIISFPAKNIADYRLDNAKPLVKSFMIRILLSLSAINNIAIFLVKFDPNMPEGIPESLRIVPMIMHGVLGVLPFYVLFKMSRAPKLK